MRMHEFSEVACVGPKATYRPKSLDLDSIVDVTHSHIGGCAVEVGVAVDGGERMEGSRWFILRESVDEVHRLIQDPGDLVSQAATKLSKATHSAFGRSDV